MLHLRRANRNPRLQALELLVSAGDVVHWVNHWCWTDDPREKGAELPFDLFPRQAEFLTWLAGHETAQKPGLVEKSRDGGITWLCCVYALHGWLFRPGSRFGFGSRKLEYVDNKGDLKTIFEKIRFALYRLPSWMLPEGFSRNAHDCHAKLINPANGATITGEGGDDIGRGDRATVYFVDEAAFLERAELIERSLSQTTNCRIDVSTPNGPGTVFCTKRFSGRVEVFVLDWKDDPRKNAWEVRDEAGVVAAAGTGPDAPPGAVYPWYEDQKRRLDPVTVAQEIDRDHTASVAGICIPAVWVRAAVGLALPESGPLVAGQDVAGEGKNLSVMVPRRGPVVGMPLAWGQQPTTQTAWRVRDEGERLGIVALGYDADGIGENLKGTWEAGRPPKFEVNPVHGGAAPSETWWPDGKTSQEKFANLRAELWWKVRRRFEKTYEYRELGTPHPLDELISLPADCPELVAQLSMPLVEYTDTGKIRLESKEKMRRRGIASPDHADALIYSFAVDGVAWEAVEADPRETSVLAGAPDGLMEFLDEPRRW